MKRKLFLVTGVSLFVIVFALFLISSARKADSMGKGAVLFFLQNTLTLMLPDDNGYELMSPVSSDSSMGPISWREKVANFYREMNQDGYDYSELFRFPFDNGKHHTSIVAIIGEGTVWDEKLRKHVLRSPIDKILLIEVPHKNVRWNSPEDYDIDKAIQLWSNKPIYRGLWKERGIQHITLHGKHGRISDFKSKEDFKNHIIFTDEEINMLLNIPYNSPLYLHHFGNDGAENEIEIK